MKYVVKLTNSVINEIKYLRKSGEINAVKKIKTLLSELEEHPYTGTGKPEPLRHNRAGQWSRRITSKYRLVYIVKDQELIVLIISASSHYGDK